MDEIVLSNDLNVITAEVKSWKSMAGMSIWEIGRRLKHVKENDLAHGQYLEWLKTVSIDRTEAHRYIKVAENLPNDDTWQHLSTRALYMIATLPEEERKKEHVTSKGETKTVDEMTILELQEVKRKNKELEREAEQARRSEQIALKQLEEAENKEPEVIRETVEKEVIPANYKELESAERRLKSENRRLSEETETLKRRLQKLESNSAEVERLERTITQLNEKKAEVNRILDANDKLSELEEEFHAFFDQKMAPLKYKPLVNELHNFNGSERMKELVNLARSWVDDMDRMLPHHNRKSIEGEIING